MGYSKRKPVGLGLGQGTGIRPCGYAAVKDSTPIQADSQGVNWLGEARGQAVHQ